MLLNDSKSVPLTFFSQFLMLISLNRTHKMEYSRGKLILKLAKKAALKQGDTLSEEVWESRSGMSNLISGKIFFTQSGSS